MAIYLLCVARKRTKAHECPNRSNNTKPAHVKVVVTLTPKEPKIVYGKVGSSPCSML